MGDRAVAPHKVFLMCCVSGIGVLRFCQRTADQQVAALPEFATLD